MKKVFSNFFNKSIEKSTTKNKLLSFSLMWMGIGVATIFLMTYLVISVPVVSNLILKLSSSLGWSFLLVINFALIIGLSFFSRKLNFSSLIIVYIVFIFIEGLFVSSTLFRFGFNTNSGMNNIFLLFLIPSVIFILMGILGYFQIFDFSKILPFLFFATIGLIIFSVVLIFIGGNIMEKWYSLFGVVIFSLWIGFDIWWIQRKSEYIESMGGISKNEMSRLGLLSGLNLFIDFVQVLIFVARLILR